MGAPQRNAFSRGQLPNRGRGEGAARGRGNGGGKPKRERKIVQRGIGRQNENTASEATHSRHQSPARPPPRTKRPDSNPATVNGPNPWFLQKSIQALENANLQVTETTYPQGFTASPTHPQTGFLAPAFNCKFLLDDWEYQSPAHYMLAAKALAHGDLAEWKAILQGKRNDQIFDGWVAYVGEGAAEDMAAALQAKFTTSPLASWLKKALLATHERTLRFVDDGEFWGVGKGGKGQNELGRLLMEFRARQWREAKEEEGFETEQVDDVPAVESVAGNKREREDEGDEGEEEEAAKKRVKLDHVVEQHDLDVAEIEEDTREYLDEDTVDFD